MTWTDDDMRAAVVDALSSGKVWNGKQVTALEWANLYVSEYGRRNVADKAESELAAARKVEDGEVASYALRLHTIANHALDPSPARDDLHHAADLLTRLSAALKEAERRSLDNAVRAHGWMVQHDTLVGFIQARQSVLNELIDNDPRPASPKPSDVPDIIARAQAAEAKLESARRDALEEAAKVCDTISFVKTTPQKQIGARMCAAKLRALQTKDTTP